MVLIATTLGAIHAYRDHEMLRRTFHAFLESLFRQTRDDWWLFVSYHDLPDWLRPPREDPRITWSCVSGDPEHGSTLVWDRLPETVDDPGDRKIESYGSAITDMGRKTFNSVVEAGRWAWRERLTDGFWMLRMDSDDLLAMDVMDTLHAMGRDGVEAVYNRNCHMFDPRRMEMAEYRYPYSTTCNAMWMRFRGRELPNWFYHCHDHTTFMRSVRQDGIRAVEVDWSLCIVTNSGNSISGRPEIDREKNVAKIPLTDSLVERYGLDSFGMGSHV